MERQRPRVTRGDEDRVPLAYGAPSGADRIADAHRSAEDEHGGPELFVEHEPPHRHEAQHRRCANGASRRGGRSFPHDEAEVRAAALRDGAGGPPFSFETGAGPRGIEESAAVPAKAQLQAASRHEHERPAVARVGGELAVALDPGETQTPGECLCGGRVPGDLESRPSAVAPAHAPIGLVFEDRESRALHAGRCHKCDPIPLQSSKVCNNACGSPERARPGAPAGASRAR
jgi:hypothetical protein